MSKHQFYGGICETILTEHFLRLDYYVFIPLAANGPADLIAVHKVTHKIVLLDAKKDRIRQQKNRRSPSRIHRKRTDVQKKLGVRIAYVNIDTRAVHIVPPIK